MWTGLHVSQASQPQLTEKKLKGNSCTKNLLIHYQHSNFQSLIIEVKEVNFSSDKDHQDFLKNTFKYDDKTNIIFS